ncbi:choice-of-anchor A family protein [Cohnella sp. 56]|uniref:choice-of-anchor A family protein n=1 Tax=Cohnella sp. 56 TaxID=3113722 RepID=UPI0030E9DA0E
MKGETEWRDEMACGNLGSANDFNLFIFGDHTQSNVDSEGRVAVGGTATYANYGVGNTLPVSTTRPDLIIQGNVNITNGTNFAGNTVVYPTSTVFNYTMTNNNGVPGQPLRGTPIDFAAAELALTELSINLAAMTPNGTVSNNFGQIVLTGTDPVLNLFMFGGNNVDGHGLRLDSANGINLIVPAGSTVVVNVGDDNVGFGSYQTFINGVAANRSNVCPILWNFFQAATAFNQNIAIAGSVLAPNANWQARGFGNIDGTMVAGSLVNAGGTLEAHDIPFCGCLPTQPPPTTTTTTSTSELPFTTTTTTTTTTELPTTTTTTTTTEVPTTTTTTTELPTTTTTTTTTEVPTTTTTTVVPTTTTTTTAVPPTTTTIVPTTTTTPVPTTTTASTTAPPLLGPRITAVKTASVQSARLGDIIRFVVVVSNTGTSAGDVVLSDDLPRELLFIPASVVIDGVPALAQDLNETTVLGTLVPGQTVTVAFEAIVAAYPPRGQVVNGGSVIALVPGTAPPLCSLGEAIVGSPPGVYPIPDQMLPVLLVFKPGVTPLPGQTSTTGPVLMPNGSVGLADPVTVPGITLAPIRGVTLGDPLGVPTPIVQSAPIIIAIPQLVPGPNLIVFQRAFNDAFFVGQRITYSIFVINDGSLPVIAATLRDTLPPESRFIDGTVRVNGQLRLQDDPGLGIQLGPIPSAEGTVVRYDLLITGKPGSAAVVNSSQVSATFLRPDNQVEVRPYASRPISNPLRPDGLLPFFSLTKQASRTHVNVWDTYRYDFFLRNLSGSLHAQNVTFFDRLAAPLQFVSGSLRLDGVPQLDPQVGLAIGHLAPGQSRHISFEVRVMFHPVGDRIVNQAGIFFEIRFDGECYRAGVLSNESVVFVAEEEEE